MAGKFLSIEEAARRLGVSVDEVNRLIDRKELFPMRDGSTIKFKSEEVERAAASLGFTAADDGDDLTLDLGLPGAGLDLDLPVAAPPLDLTAAAPAAAASRDSDADSLAPAELVDDESIFVGDASGVGGPSGSQTVVRGGEAAASSGVLDVDELSLESLAPAASPSLAIGDHHGEQDESATMELDLGDLEAGGFDVSVPGLPGPGGGSHAGGSLATAADSGLSLEKGDLEISGIDLDTSLLGGAAGSGATQALEGSLAGDAFDLGAELADDESASVVIPTEESGDSSFFGDPMDDSASITLDESDISTSAPSLDLPSGDMVPAAPSFSVWQIVGLICCTMLLFVGGLVVFDVLLTVRSPQGIPVSSPLLNAFAESFGF